MSKRRSGNRGNLVRCYLSDEELSAINRICSDLGWNKSELLRNRLLHPDMLNINSAKLLSVLSEIGMQMSLLNASIDHQQKGVDYKNGDTEKLEALINSYHLQQKKLEQQIRKLLMRIERKG
ncbi:hypothetical protein [Pedobacter agri]|uniref:Uncharacterized protein n=1 Tax=Pedobacter agri TaxID=454586 RepID=A0A9X3I7F3_9SPHI|nr:hypothetical protein [Pedobacter agri]MCX3263681.1 hypothetical protein [Pedobacter agri]